MNLQIVNRYIHRGAPSLLELFLRLVQHIRIDAPIDIVKLRWTINGIAELVTANIRFHIRLMSFMNHIAEVNGARSINAIDFQVINIVNMGHFHTSSAKFAQYSMFSS